MRLLHIADLHLDRAFGGLAFGGCDSARRRELLRRALEWAVDLAIENQAAALTVGGDLFELEHVTADTVAFITRQLGRLECPVVITPGNHDFTSPASPYRVAHWPANVILVPDARPVAVDLGEMVVVGIGYSGRDLSPAALDRLPPRGSETRPRLLLVHGVDLDSLTTDFHWGGLGLHAADLDRIGFDHALMGHVHAGRVGGRMSWPGSPVPLDPGETTGLHGALWVEVSDGRLAVSAVDAGIAHFESVSVDVTEITDSSQLAAAVGAELALLGADTALVTCRLTGRRPAGLAVDTGVLSDQWAPTVLGLNVVDATVPELDVQELAREPTARGAAIAKLLEDGSAQALWAAQLVAEAFEGEVRVPA